VIHGDLPEWVTEGGLDSVTQYELWKSIWSSLNDGNFYELAHAVKRHLGFCRTFTPFTFVGNHDVTRIASKLTDISTLGHALAVLFTLPGIPSIYYGDEQGFRGVKEDREGGDDAVRPAFPPAPADLAPDGWPIYRLHQALIGLRRRESWLTTAGVEVLELANDQLSYRCSGGDGQGLIVLLNIADEPHTFDVGGPVEVLLDDGNPSAGDPDQASGVPVTAKGWAIVRVGS
jgi:cyclomaltodextrinase